MRHRYRAAPPGPTSAERLLMFAIALNGDGARRKIKRLGVTAPELEAVFSGSEQELAEARQLSIAAAVLTRERLGALLRARIGELALTATKAGELAALARALERLPDWVLDGAEDEQWETAEPAPEPARAEAPAPVAAAAVPPERHPTVAAAAVPPDSPVRRAPAPANAGSAARDGHPTGSQPLTTGHRSLIPDH